MAAPRGIPAPEIVGLFVGASFAEKGQEVFDKDLASGEKPKSKALGRAEAGFAPWRIGAT
jgi:hypothetical protein